MPTNSLDRNYPIDPDALQPPVDLYVKGELGEWVRVPTIAEVQWTHKHGPWVNLPQGWTCRGCGELLREVRR